ncbi:MAG: hemolysin family protein [Phycisphaerales bacterium]|nr:hemolysin family protein [Phycisphaerales bacterium]
MSDPWIWLTILSALGGAYLSVLQLSLEDFTRGDLESRLEPGRWRARVDWLMDHVDDVIIAVAIWRRASAVVLLASVLAGVALPAAEPLWPIVISSFLVFLWMWIAHIGLAWAASDYVAAPVVAGSLRVLPLMYYATLPLIAPLNWLNEVVRRLVGAENRDDLEVELRQVVEESEREGHLTGAEKEMIEAIVDFRTCTVGEIMTPRIDIDGLELTDDLQAVKQKVIDDGHSRFPVYIDSLDHIVGILYAKDLLPFVGQESGEFRLRPLLRQAILVPESRRISDLLVEFRNEQVHMAIVLDEYGGTAGLVTIEDIVEEIVGEIRDEHDVEEPPEQEVTRNEDGSADVDGRSRVTDLNDDLGLDLPEEEDFDTVAGWVFANLGRIPASGETFRIGNVEVTVLQVERTRLRRLRLRLVREEDVKVAPDEVEAK